MQQGVVATDYKDEIFFQTWKLSKKHKKMIMDKKSGKNNQDQKTWETPSADFKGEKKTLQFKSIAPRADSSQKNVELVQETKSWLLASPS